ncbi:hypothetical protein SKAU_G00363430 [Synaphobranchus kaupii]|uniref:Uncharacterized protein n=1 Tax=Synaphobranchus kaupii TaxID=118154 RepID=A0A9Q1IH34_SYNKA|nr:hypothetical protein SKAU_G00363430 [Synaphobranchus kaupii]
MILAVEDEAPHFVTKGCESPLLREECAGWRDERPSHAHCSPLLWIGWGGTDSPRHLPFRADRLTKPGGRGASVTQEKIRHGPINFKWVYLPCGIVPEGSGCVTAFTGFEHLSLWQESLSVAVATKVVLGIRGFKAGLL